MRTKALLLGCLVVSASLVSAACGSSDDGSGDAAAGSAGASGAGASPKGGSGGSSAAAGKGGASGKSGGGGVSGKGGTAGGASGASGKAGSGGTTGTGGAAGKGATGGASGKGGGAQAGTTATGGTTGTGGNPTGGAGTAGDPTGGVGGDPTGGAGTGGDPTGGTGGDPTGAGGDPTGGGGTGSGATGGSGACPPPPAGVSSEAAAAYAAENDARAAIGSPCATMVPALNTSAQAHCDYFTSNTGACVANPHTEVASCAKYVAADFWNREKAAGYSGSAVFEDMAFFGSGASAVQIWIDSVWHRTPVLSPWVMDFGYGGLPGCDTADFGNGASSPADLVVSYPYAGQSGVPTSFGGNEGPQPPAPPGGFPSGYPITVFLKGGSITTHELFLDGDSTPIPHVFIAPGDAAANGLLQNDYVLYANKPLTAKTTYRVKITGTNGAGPVNLDWTFTTQ